MKIRNILVTGNLSIDMKKIIDVESYHQSFRFMEEEDVTSADLQWADGYVSFKPTPNFDFYNLKWIHSVGAGVDHFLFNRQWKEDVLLTRTICSFGQRISQYCLSYYLKDLQKHDYFQAQQKDKQWQPDTPELIDGRKVLVYGTGEIAQEVAKLFSLLGMEVYGVSLSGKQQAYFTEVYKVTSEIDVLSEADVIINTLPLTKNTESLFGENRFKSMNKTVFINVGRGGSLVESALLHGLENKNIRLAVLDVFKEEPLPNTNRLWEHEKVIVTPHISAVTTAEEAVSCFLETLKNIENNKELKNKVDITKGY